MTTDALLPQLQEIFRTIFENKTLVISPSTSAKEIDNWDSMNHILLITEIEQHFDISFELDDLIAMIQVSDILTGIHSKLGV